MVLYEAYISLYKMRITPIPVTVNSFSVRQQFETSKAKKVASAMRTVRIPVTVGTFQTRRKHERPKLMTVTRMAVLRRQKRRRLRGWRCCGFVTFQGGVGGRGYPGGSGFRSGVGAGKAQCSSTYRDHVE